MTIKLTVTHTDNNDEESNLPSSFFPGAGAGSASFKLEISEEKFPSHTELSWALQEWNDDCVLMDYDASIGTGRFVIVDWYSPTSGTIIKLNLAKDSKMDI